MESVRKSKCQKDQNDLLVAFDVLKLRSDTLESNLNTSISHFSKISASFTCALCEQKNGFNFKNEGQNGAKISIDMDMCENIFNSPNSKKAFKFFNDAYYVNIFVETFSCLGFTSISLEPVIEDKKLGDILHQANKCQEIGDWINDERCLAVCSSLPFINQNLFYKMMTPIAISNNLIRKIIKSQTNDNNFRIEEILIDQIKKEKIKLTQNKKNIEFKFFIDSIEDKIARIEDFVWDVRSKGGWNLDDSPIKQFMNYHRINLSLMISITGFIISLFS